MIETFEEGVQELLKVPRQPEAPFGATGSVRVFQAAKGFFHYRLLGWAGQQVLLLTSVGLGLIGASAASEEVPGGQIFWFVELATLAVLILQVPLTFLMIALDFRYRWYIVTDRSLRIREGVWQVQERTMTFSNIQNISIRQGPVQRLLGIADLEVRTAGGGGDMPGGRHQQSPWIENLHIGYFRGVGNAEEIRDTILRRLRNVQATGLGDPDDAVRHKVEENGAREERSGAAQALVAARSVLAEVQALRAESPFLGR